MNIGDVVNGNTYQYLVLSFIVQTDLSRTYVAANLAKKQHVVIKVATAGSEDLIEREAEALKNINHPNIVKYIEDFVYKGERCLVIEYLEGETLETLLHVHKQRLSESKAIEFGVTILKALDYAHSKGFYHNDIKPGNVIDNHGNPTIFDFGITRHALPNSGHTSTVISLSISPYYGAPEQRAWSDNGSPCVDIYSTGVLIYDLITGQASGVFPFMPLDRLTLPIDPVTDLPGISPALKKVLMKATSAKAALRYQSIREFIKALEEILGAMPKIIVTQPAPIKGIPWDAVKRYYLTVENQGALLRQPLRVSFKGSPAWMRIADMQPADQDSFPKKLTFEITAISADDGMNTAHLQIYDGVSTQEVPIKVEVIKPKMLVTLTPAQYPTIRFQRRFDVILAIDNPTATEIPYLESTVVREDHHVPELVCTRAEWPMRIIMKFDFRGFEDREYRNTLILTAWDSTRQNVLSRVEVPIVVSMD